MRKSRQIPLFVHGLFLTTGIILGLVLASIYVQNNRVIEPYYKAEVFRVPKEVAVLETATERKIKIPIVTYHYVEYVDEADLGKKRLNINPSVLERELKALADAGYETYFVRDIPDLAAGRTEFAPKSVILSFDDGYEDFYSIVLPMLKKYNKKATLYVINNYIGRAGFLKSWQIREIIASGLVEIGAHTLDHTYLKSAPKAIVTDQIVESKVGLEEEYGIIVSTFAYPYGAFDLNAIEAVQKAGFTAAVSVVPGTEQSEENMFYLSRYRAGMFSGDIIGSLEKLMD